MKNWLLLSAMLLANAVQAADLPAQGMSMSAVQKQYGAPAQKLPAIGKPPITRWVYPDFTVVFERKHVIHSMTVRKAGAPAPVSAPTGTSGKGEATIKIDVQ